MYTVNKIHKYENEYVNIMYIYTIKLSYEKQYNVDTNHLW